MTQAGSNLHESTAARSPRKERGRPEVDRLKEELAAAGRREAELRELLAEAHDQLAQRDEELVRSALAHRRLEEIYQTRVWRAGALYWRTRDRTLGWFRGLLRRRRT